MTFNLKRLLPLLCLLTIMLLFFLFDFQRYLTMNYIHKYFEMLRNWRDDYFITSLILYMLCYVVVTASFIPFASFLTVFGGLIFGTWLATLMVVFSASLGASIGFASTKYALHSLDDNENNPWIDWLKTKMTKNTFLFLVFLRLVPVIPFWLLNLTAGLFNVSFLTFILSTFIGIIPGTVLFAMVGHQMSTIMSLKDPPIWSHFINTGILLPLFALALLSLLPIGYRKYFMSRQQDLSEDKK